MAFTNRPWADEPFKLIPPPGDGQDLNKLHEAVFLAHEMACAHNGMLRSLNSIYQQCIYLEQHHEAEEKIFFPDVERITKVQDMMAGMATQHRDFTPGLEELTKYVHEISVEAYDSKELRRIMDGFGPVLTNHLTEEVNVLLALKVHDRPALKKAYLKFDTELRKGDKSILFPIVLGSSDSTYEQGREWPEVPSFIGIWSTTGSSESTRAHGDSVLPRPGENGDRCCLQASQSRDLFLSGH